MNALAAARTAPPLTLVTRSRFWRWQAFAWLIYGVAMFFAAAQELPALDALVNKSAGTLIGFGLTLGLRELYGRLRSLDLAPAVWIASMLIACALGGALWSALVNPFFWWWLGADLAKAQLDDVFAWTLLHAYVLVAWCAVYVGAQQVDETSRLRAMELARLSVPPAAAAPLVVRADGATVRLPQEDILSIEAARNYSCIVSTRGTHVVRMPLSALERQLDAARLLRVHRSAIVAVESVRSVRVLSTQDAIATLVDGREIRVSRGFRAQLERALAR